MKTLAVVAVLLCLCAPARAQHCAAKDLMDAARASGAEPQFAAPISIGQSAPKAAPRAQARAFTCPDQNVFTFAEARRILDASAPTRSNAALAGRWKLVLIRDAEGQSCRAEGFSTAGLVIAKDTGSIVGETPTGRIVARSDANVLRPVEGAWGVFRAAALCYPDRTEGTYELTCRLAAPDRLLCDGTLVCTDGGAKVYDTSYRLYVPAD